MLLGRNLSPNNGKIELKMDLGVIGRVRARRKIKVQREKEREDKTKQIGNTKTPRSSNSAAKQTLVTEVSESQISHFPEENNNNT